MVDDDGKPDDYEPVKIELMDKGKAYDIVAAYANEQESELAEAMLSVLWNSQMDYEYIEGLLIHFCKCGCAANGLWDEGTYMHSYVKNNDIQFNEAHTQSCKFCGLE